VAAGTDMVDLMSIREELHIAEHSHYFAALLCRLPPQLQSLESNRLTVLHFSVGGLGLLRSLHLADRERLLAWIRFCSVFPAPASTGGHNEAANLSSEKCFGFRSSTLLLAKPPSSGKATSPEEVSTTAELTLMQSLDEGHLAMTYSALVAMRVLGDSLSSIPRAPVMDTIRRLQTSCGSFKAHSRALRD
jgi:prenyltransferase beta subunit